MFKIIASIIIILLFIYILIYKTQMKKMRQEVDFIINNQTNKQITGDLSIRELNQLADSLNHLIDSQKSLVQKYIMKDQDLTKAITNISHDIRTPLTSLSGYFQLLNQSNSEEERERYILIIHNRIETLKNLLENNFLYLKSLDDHYQRETERLNLNQVLQDNLFTYYEEFKNKEIEPTIAIPSAPTFINANLEAFNRIIHNLIQNSLNHGVEFIAISVTQKEGKVQLVFENGSKNTANIEIENIFNRFYKEDTARTTDSSGLGLTIVSKLVENMDGQIEVETTPNTFKIEISIPSAN